MTTTTEQARQFWENALTSQKGTQLTCKSYNAAVNLRQALYRFRKAEQRRSTEVYAAGHPAYGTSAYDDMTIQLTQGEKTLRIVKGINDVTEEEL